MNKLDPTDPDPPDDLAATFGLRPIAGLDDWATRADELVAMMHDGARHTKALWTVRHQWLGMTELKRLDVLARLINQARQHHAKAPSRPGDKLDSDRVLDIISDLWHAVNHDRGDRRD